jgi:hypothetical protein
MSDRTPVQLTIYACPPDNVAEVVSLLTDDEDNDTFDNIDYGGEIPTDRLITGRQYTADEMVVGHAGTLAADLIELGVTFQMVEEPKYEWDGEWYVNVPGIDSASLGCSGEGTPHVAVHEIDGAIAVVEDEITGVRGALAYQRLVELLNQLTGKKLRDAIAALRDQEPGELFPAEVAE